MSTELYLRFKGRKAFVPVQIPLTPETQQCFDVLYSADDTPPPYPVLDKAAEDLREVLRTASETELRCHATRKAWVEIPDNKKLSIGDLTFAVLDLPWEELRQEAEYILMRFGMWKPEISANLFEEYDWRTYRKEQPVSPKEEPALSGDRVNLNAQKEKPTSPREKSAIHKRIFNFLLKKSPAAGAGKSVEQKSSHAHEAPAVQSQSRTEGLGTEPLPYRRTIQEGLEKPLDAIYCHAVMLYRELHILLADYPTMQTLMDRYALNITSDNFLEIQKNHDLLNLDPGDLGLMMANGFFDVLHREIIYGNDLVTWAEYFEAYLRSYPESPIDAEELFWNATDYYLSEVAYCFVAKMHFLFARLEQMQPFLSHVVENTLVKADGSKNTSSDQLFLNLQLHGTKEIQILETLQRRVSNRMIPSLSFPEESAKARSHPDITSRMFFVSSNPVDLATLDFLQMCTQHLTARRCERCGKLFVPFGENAKYCERTGPNDGKCTCQKAAADAAAAKKREENIVHREYTRIGNRLNTGMTRKSISKADREEIMRLWRAQIEPIMERANAEPAAFDRERFEAKLVAVHNEVHELYRRQQWEDKMRKKGYISTRKKG